MAELADEFTRMFLGLAHAHEKKTCPSLMLPTYVLEMKYGTIKFLESRVWLYRGGAGTHQQKSRGVHR